MAHLAAADPAEADQLPTSANNPTSGTDSTDSSFPMPPRIHHGSWQFRQIRHNLFGEIVQPGGIMQQQQHASAGSSSMQALEDALQDGTP